MQLCTVEPLNATALLARLTEVERIRFRRASLGELEHMQGTGFRADGPPSMETMIEVQNILLKQHAEHFDGPWWTKQTWLF